MRTVSSLLALLTAFLFSTAASAVDAPPLWVVKGLAQPASALYVPAEKSIYVSNLGATGSASETAGFISKLGADGQLIQLDWVTGLKAPKGMASAPGRLFVADRDQVVEIDVKSAQIVKRYSAPGANLTDISLEYHSQYKNQTARGNASDTTGNAIWYLADGGISKSLADASLGAPTGVLMEQDDLRFVSSGSTGRIKTVPKDGDTASDRFGSAPIGDLTSLEPDGKGGYWVDEASSGKIWHVSSTGTSLLWLTVGPGAGDLGQIPGKALLVPLASGELRAYALAK